MKEIINHRKYMGFSPISNHSGLINVERVQGVGVRSPYEVIVYYKFVPGRIKKVGGETADAGIF